MRKCGLMRACRCSWGKCWRVGVNPPKYVCYNVLYTGEGSTGGLEWTHPSMSATTFYIRVREVLEGWSEPTQVCLLQRFIYGWGKCWRDGVNPPKYVCYNVLYTGEGSTGGLEWTHPSVYYSILRTGWNLALLAIWLTRPLTFYCVVNGSQFQEPMKSLTWLWLKAFWAPFSHGQTRRSYGWPLPLSKNLRVLHELW